MGHLNSWVQHYQNYWPDEGRLGLFQYMVHSTDRYRWNQRSASVLQSKWELNQLSQYRIVHVPSNHHLNNIMITLITFEPIPKKWYSWKSFIKSEIVLWCWWAICQSRNEIIIFSLNKLACDPDRSIGGNRWYLLIQ